MRARLDECAGKGFDGIEPDNMEAYTNDTGFPLTYEDQLTYNIWLAEEAHARGLSIGLKNDGEQVNNLLSFFDWALTEDCFAYEWCEELLPLSKQTNLFSSLNTPIWTSRSKTFAHRQKPGTSALFSRIVIWMYIEKPVSNL